MSFAAPAMLVLLALVPLAAAGYLWLERRRERQAEAWSTAGLLPNMAPRPPRWQRTLPPALLLAGAALLLVGFARPQARVTVSRQEATFVVVLDVSGSMAARDVAPSRLAAAKGEIRRLVAALPASYRMALITFSDRASLVAPPTPSRPVVLGALSRAHTGPQGTALADAVIRAVAVAKSVPGKHGRRPPASVLVFSDGAQTAGRVSPAQAGEVARQAGVRVSAVAVGTPGGVVHQALPGGYTESIAVPVQTAALVQVAQASGGRVFASARDPQIDRVLHELGSRLGTRRKTVEVAAAAAGGGLVLMLLGGVLSGVWFRRVA